jgi:hypothetical protein
MPSVETSSEVGFVDRGSARLGGAFSRVRVLGGGTDGNEQLTAIVGAVLTVPLLVLGVTILRVRQLISVHLFLGLLLIGPVLAKLASTCYRFVRYYEHNPEYRRKGPPELYLRLSAPVLVLTTVIVFVSGVVLLFLGPANRGNWLAIHKVSFIVWGVIFALHFLGHLAEMPASFHAVRRAHASDARPGATPGDTGRWITLVGALVGGLVLAIVLIPEFGAWTAHGPFPHHHQ